MQTKLKSSNSFFELLLKKLNKSKKQTNTATKKKYKTINQKAGSEITWTFCVSLKDFFPNLFKKNYMELPIVPPPFNVTIKKNKSLLFGEDKYSISNINGNEFPIIPIILGHFITMLIGKKDEFITIHREDDDIVSYASQDLLKKLGYYTDKNTNKNPNYNKNLCILYHIVFFEDCIPEEFNDLYDGILGVIRNSFDGFKKMKESERARLAKKKESNRFQTNNTFKLLKHKNEISELNYYESDEGIRVMNSMVECLEKIRKTVVKCPQIENKRCKRWLLNHEGIKIREFNESIN